MCDPLYELTEHAKQRVAERSIQLDWISRAFLCPAKVSPHPDDESCRYAYVVIPEYRNRVLKVVYNYTENPPRVVTAFFDRKMRGKL